MSEQPTPDASPRPGRKGSDKPAGEPGGGWRATLRTYRQELTFITLFAVLLGGGFTLISLQPVNDALIEPFTAGVAKASGLALKAIGQDIEMKGTIIRSQRFAVNIRNGCNGVETMIIFIAAVLAFPAPWPARGIGVILGCLAIQAINLVRVVALFLTGAYFPRFFDNSHTVIWQTIVILFGVLLWIFWAHRFATPPARPAQDAA